MRADVSGATSYQNCHTSSIRGPASPLLVPYAIQVMKVPPRLVELTQFGTVGALAWVVDLAVFNLVRAALPLQFVLAAKVAAVLVAACFSWLLNRLWTFRSRATDRPGRELLIFLVVNALGLTPPLLCLWVSHYLLGWTSVWADNISANVVGLALGTVLRYFGYRYLVFSQPATAPTDR